jgi:Flp pilus assembly protein TadG
MMYRPEFASLKNSTGAAAVEFVAALLGLLIFFAIYMQFAQIFIAHERLRFAGFASSRTFAVLGEGPARQVAAAIDSQVLIRFEPDAVFLERGVGIPEAFRPIFTSGAPEYRLENRTPAFDEIKLLMSLPAGDN